MDRSGDDGDHGPASRRTRRRAGRAVGEGDAGREGDEGGGWRAQKGGGAEARGGPSARLCAVCEANSRIAIRPQACIYPAWPLIRPAARSRGSEPAPGQTHRRPTCQSRRLSLPRLFRLSSSSMACVGDSERRRGRLSSPLAAHGDARARPRLRRRAPATPALTLVRDAGGPARTSRDDAQRPTPPKPRSPLSFSLSLSLASRHAALHHEPENSDVHLVEPVSSESLGRRANCWRRGGHARLTTAPHTRYADQRLLKAWHAETGEPVERWL